jgi:hypothetical protein
MLQTVCEFAVITGNRHREQLVFSTGCRWSAL